MVKSSFTRKRKNSFEVIVTGVYRVKLKNGEILCVEKFCSNKSLTDIDFFAMKSINFNEYSCKIGQDGYEIVENGI